MINPEELTAAYTACVAVVWYSAFIGYLYTTGFEIKENSSKKKK